MSVCAHTRPHATQVLAVGLAWFATVPVSVVIASLMDPYLRAKVVAIMRVLVDASLVAALVWLVAPARLVWYMFRV